MLTLIDKIVRAVALYCGGAVLAVLMMVIIVDVTGRYVFNTPLDGSLDLSIVLLVLAVSCAIGYGGRTGAHVTADMVTTVVGPKFEWISGIGIKAMAAGVTSIWSWRAVRHRLDRRPSRRKHSASEHSVRADLQGAFDRRPGFTPLSSSSKRSCWRAVARSRCSSTKAAPWDPRND